MPEMLCPACGKETLVIREPVYDGFTRIGERMKCAVCSHIFDAPQSAPAPKKGPSIFTDDDRPAPIKLFKEGENRTICRYCHHYIVNPFKQVCGLHRREVEATDTCDQFTVREDKNPPAKT